MMMIDEIEASCGVSELIEFPKHPIEGPELPLRSIYFPLGFPVEIATNSEVVLDYYAQMWGNFERQQETAAIQVQVQITEGGSDECPPEPTHRLMLPLFMTVADRDNYSVLALDRCVGRISLTRNALRHRLFVQYFLLAAPLCFLTTRYTTPVHAGCVALDGKGVLLCGDSGAGKSTLSYACARAGWTYVSDDASHLQNGGEARLVSGDCYKVRFRPSAVNLFPELEGLEETPRAAGKPSIEFDTHSLNQLTRAQSATVDYIVFLNRGNHGPQQLLPYRKEIARQYMRQTPFGSVESLTRQYQAIERLLNAKIFELRYSSLEWAVDRLRKLVQAGQ